MFFPRKPIATARMALMVSAAKRPPEVVRRVWPVWTSVDFSRSRVGRPRLGMRGRDDGTDRPSRQAAAPANVRRRYSWLDPDPGSAGGAATAALGTPPPPP